MYILYLRVLSRLLHYEHYGIKIVIAKRLTSNCRIWLFRAWALPWRWRGAWPPSCTARTAKLRPRRRRSKSSGNGCPRTGPPAGIRRICCSPWSRRSEDRQSWKEMKDPFWACPTLINTANWAAPSCGKCKRKVQVASWQIIFEFVTSFSLSLYDVILVIESRQWSWMSQWHLILH